MKNFKTRLATAGFALAAGLFSTDSANAGIIFSNAADATGGGSNWFSNGDGVSPGGRFVAQDFVVGNSSTLTSLTFNAYTTVATTPLTSINVKVFSDNTGSVGAELFSGSFALAGSAYTQSLYEPDFLFDLYDYSVLIPNWNLSSGSYWLGLKVDPAQVDLHWSISGDNLGSGLYGSYVGDAVGDATSFANNAYDWEHVFRLEGTAATGVPETGSTLLMLGLALVGLGWVRRQP